MSKVYDVVLGLSLVLNGAMVGLIAGHLATHHDACDCGCDCRKPKRDRGPYPTGWVVPDDTPEPEPVVPKPKPKPNGAMP